MWIRIRNTGWIYGSTTRPRNRHNSFVMEAAFNSGMCGKLTGAGGGGFAIALVPPSMTQPALAAAKLELQAKGYTCSEEGVRSLLATA
jgi:mevalonate kinase